MTIMTLTQAGGRAPLPVRGFAAFGVLWSLFGAYQFIRSTTSSAEALMAMGLTPEQAALYANSPFWMDAAFALGTLGGVLGSLLLALGRRAAVPVLGLSLAGYVVLYVGDVVTGVFAAFGAPQVAVLTLVVIVAAALSGTAVRLARAGRLA